VDAGALDAALRQLTSVGVRTLTSQPPTLEELFLRHYGNTTGAGARHAEVAR
jgi:ABC-2 type transport system ATP-binding protein